MPEVFLPAGVCNQTVSANEMEAQKLKFKT